MRIAIIGAGVVGLQAAYRAVSEGIEVTVYEQAAELGFGASGHTAGVLHVLQPPFINRKARLAKKANPLYDGLAAELGFRILRMPLYLVYTSRKERFLGVFAASLLKLVGYKASLANRDEVVSSCPEISSDVIGGVKVEGYGTVIPKEVLKALAKGILEKGGSIIYSAKVESIREHNQKVCINHINGSECYDKVVIAAGPGVVNLVQGKIPKIGYYKGVMVYVKFDCNSIIAPLVSRARSKETKGGGIIPLPDGRVLLGPSFIETQDPWDTKVSTEEVFSTIDLYSKLLPDTPKILSADAGTRSKNLSKDDFYIDKKGRIIVTAGIDSPGFTASPLIADIIIRLATFP
ncbi:MAG: FAD-binding oxidoreductase [Desulfurococcales archaeon]|nr:FAD-binding oxidoreductase [Desulfurococcales archaeon]